MSNTRRFIALLLAASTVGCTSLQPVAQPAEFIATQQPSFVVITTQAIQEGDDPIVINAPRVQDGALSGLLYGEETRVPLDKIQTVQAKQFNKRRTVNFAIGSAFILGGLTYLAVEAGNRRDDEACRPDGKYLSCGGAENGVSYVGGLRLRFGR